LVRVLKAAEKVRSLCPAEYSGDGACNRVGVKAEEFPPRIVYMFMVL
jgi:hypothetical protein